jgi:hypothetical protein
MAVFGAIVEQLGLEFGDGRSLTEGEPGSEHPPNR